MIKKIHYCWFGGNPLPESAKKCINSWKKYCPGFEIVEWNEKNFDVNVCAYTREAYQAKKWAFVSDYARFKILYLEGGLYFDTDVEMIKPIDDIISKGAFMGCEAFDIAPGLGLYAPPQLSIYKEFLEHYEQQHFIRKDGLYDLKTVGSRVTKILCQYGYDIDRINETQTIRELKIYPSDFFCPIDYSTRNLCITKNTRTIHHYDGSWYNERERYWSELKLKMNKYLPTKISARAAFIISYLKYESFISLIKYLRNKRKNYDVF